MFLDRPTSGESSLERKRSTGGERRGATPLNCERFKAAIGPDLRSSTNENFLHLLLFLSSLRPLLLLLLLLLFLFLLLLLFFLFILLPLLSFFSNSNEKKYSRGGTSSSILRVLLGFLPRASCGSTSNYVLRKEECSPRNSHERSGPSRCRCGGKRLEKIAWQVFERRLRGISSSFFPLLLLPPPLLLLLLLNA